MTLTIKIENPEQENTHCKASRLLINRLRRAQSLVVSLLIVAGVACVASAQSFSVPTPAGSGGSILATGDFNGDGKPDMVAIFGGVSVLINKGDGTFQTGGSYSTDGMTNDVTVADFNGDGKLDIATSNLRGSPSSTDSVGVLLGNGDGTFGAVISTAVANPVKIKAAEMSSDGKCDVIIISDNGNSLPAGTFSVLLGNGDGTFHSPTTYPVDPFSRVTASSLVISDFNLDGKNDLAMATSGGPTLNGAVAMFLGKGDGTFQDATYSNIYGPMNLAVGDLYMDGKPDLVVTAVKNFNLAGNPNMYVLRSNGDGTFQPTLSYFTTEFAGYPVIGDLNGDGNSDVVVGDYNGPNVLIFRGNGNGTLQNPFGVAAGTNPVFPVLTDFNADGPLDLAVGNNSSPNIHVLLNSPSAHAAQINATARVAASNVLAATFTDYNTSKTAANFTATINWGDDSSASTGTISANASGGFDVRGSHTYAHEGSYNVTVQIADTNDNHATAHSTATVADAPLTATGKTFSFPLGNSFTTIVATFTDADPAGKASDFSATINWGDGTSSSTGVISANNSGGFDVTGNHTYNNPGTFSVTVTINDVGGSTATADSTATVTGFTISGHITSFNGTPLEGVLVALTGAKMATTFTDASGNYSFGASSSGNYRVTPTKTNYVFNPVNQTFFGLNSNQTADFTSTQPTLGFSLATYPVNESNGSVQVTVMRSGDTADSVSVNFATSDGTAQQRTDYTVASGVISFATGETTKTFALLINDDNYVEGAEQFNVTLSNATGGAALGTQPGAIVTINDPDTTPPTSNVIDDAQNFVYQHYHDFLSREPDTDGLGYWSGQITACGSNQTCINARRVDVSNAFFFELEYQQTGAYVYRLYRAAYGNNQPFPNPGPDSLPADPVKAAHLPNYAVFSADRARVVGGSSLAQSQLDLANQFALRPEFLAKYPASLSTGAQFVDAILSNISHDLGVDLSSQRDALVAQYNTGGRGMVLYRLADDNAQTNPINNRAFIDAEYNRAFVLTEYFGYLRRDPDVAGINFWLNVLSNFPIRDTRGQHAMVCSFITSREYQERFSPVSTHSNQECGQ